MWALIEYVEVFKILFVPQEFNQLVNSLDMLASFFSPNPSLVQGILEVKILMRPSVPDNVEHW